MESILKKQVPNKHGGNIGLGTTQVYRVFPDGCNAGVFWRTLLYVNGLCLLWLAFSVKSWSAWGNAALAWSLSLQPIIFCSLLTCCFLRKKLPPLHNWLELVCCLLPIIAYAVVFIKFNALFEILGVVLPSISMIILFASLMATLAIHYFELRERAFSPALSEARLQALQSRIRPHFLFNSLNAVLATIRVDPRRAETVLEDLAELFRMLMRDKPVFITLQEELALCQQYLSVESLRLGERLQICWKIDDHLPELAMPALLLQPLVENAILHGVEPQVNALPIQIQVLLHDKHYVQLRVVNGLPNQDSKKQHSPQLNLGNGMALDNIRERLYLLYDVAATFKVIQTDHEFVVEMMIPIERHSL